MQISAKVALSITLVVAIVGGVGGYARLEQQRTAQLAAFKATNEDAIELLALAVAPAVADGRHDRVQAVLDNIANFGDRFSPVIQLEVLDRQRRVVAALDPERFNDELSPDQVDHDLALQETRSTFLGNHLEIVVPVRLKHPLGVIRATLSQDHLTAQMNEQRNSTVLISLTTMLLIGLGLHVVHQRLVAARLQRLTKNAAAIGEGKLDTRAEVVGDDEIGALGESFNAMATSIQRFTDDLEHIIEERTEELQEANRRLELLATTDQLTQVHNRRYFEDAARRALEVARRNDRPLCVALVDTDMFKSVNDTFGHPVGDEVLKAVAQVLVLNARKADLVARFGGEEFAILMPEVGIEDAAQAAERMRAALEAEVRPEVPALGDRVVTASFGVAALENADDILEDLLSAADKAMYDSKTTGRNRVTVADRRAGEAKGRVQSAEVG